MSAFQSIEQGLAGAVAHARGEQAGINEYRPCEVDAAKLRKRLGLTQEQFAARLGFPSPPLVGGLALYAAFVFRLHGWLIGVPLPAAEHP
jgi:hypothetical protein